MPTLSKYMGILDSININRCYFNEYPKNNDETPPAQQLRMTLHETLPLELQLTCNQSLGSNSITVKSISEMSYVAHGRLLLDEIVREQILKEYPH